MVLKVILKNGEGNKIRGAYGLRTASRLYIVLFLKWGSNETFKLIF